MKEHAEDLNSVRSHNEDDRRRSVEILDSIKFDGDIDLDREKTREQLGFRNDTEIENSSPNASMTDRFAAAKVEAKHRNSLHDQRQQQSEQKKISLQEDDLL